MISERRQNIDRFRNALLEKPYQGYDVLILSSSTEDEASHQQRLLERAFDDVRTENSATGRRVLIFSLIDPTEGGQVIGQVYTWKQALARARALGVDLDGLLEAGRVRVAIYHNGGKGERASPITQGLGNSRGAQSLVGTIRGASGLELEQELLLSVVLQTSCLAQTGDADSIDTYWASQLIFDGRAPEDMPRTRAPLEKFVVEVDRQSVTAKQLHDFGTALLRRDGTVSTFYGNRQFGRQNERGEWEVVEERRGEWDAPGCELSFDFGSFRMRLDMHLALMEFYDLADLWGKVDRDGRLERSDARDIDPHVIQPLVALLGGITRRGTLPSSPPPAAELRERTSGLEGPDRDRLLEPFVDELRAALGPETREALARARPEGVKEMLAFFLLNRDRSFFMDPSRVVGSIRFAPGSYWFTYRRPIDIGNEKFLMLADLTGSVQELLADGRLGKKAAHEEARTLAADARRLRGIPPEGIARYRVGETEVSLGPEELSAGVEVEGVHVRASVIQGHCHLLPGSRVVESVLNHVSGRIDAEASYLDSVTVPELVARRSVVHKVIDIASLEAEADVVSDAFREGLEDAGFPQGQVRMRVEIGYDPRARVPDAGGSLVASDEVRRTQGGKYTFAEIRRWPGRRSRGEAVESRLREEALRRIMPSGDI